MKVRGGGCKMSNVRESERESTEIRREKIHSMITDEYTHSAHMHLCIDILINMPKHAYLEDNLRNT